MSFVEQQALNDKVRKVKVDKRSKKNYCKVQVTWDSSNFYWRMAHAQVIDKKYTYSGKDVLRCCFCASDF